MKPTTETAKNSLRICLNAEMRELDNIAEKEMGIGPVLLMENAGRAATETILREFPDAGLTGQILVFAGKGNNAGDAFVVARHLLGLGRRVRVFHMLKKVEYKGAVRANFEILEKMKTRMFYLENALDLEAFFQQSKGPFWAIDGIIGTGLKGNLEGLYYDAVNLINENTDHVVSLDIPTGVSGDSGQVFGTAIQASLTVSFGFPRLGHFLPPGAMYRGKLVNVDISLPNVFKESGDKFLLRAPYVASKLSKRDRYAHKNSFGHVLVLGGSLGRTGAVSLASQAVLRTGAGLATSGTWNDSIGALIHQLPAEVMSVVLPKDEAGYEQYRVAVQDYSSIVIGPGMGPRPEGRKLLELLLRQYHGPMVIDADALNMISEHNLHHLCLHRKGPTVLTPHVGEMARLLKWTKDEVLADPVAAVKKCVELTHAVVLLKGAATLLGSPQEKLFVNHMPNEGMATAGSGDVLAGMIGALMGQGLESFDAACVGVYLHSLAGDISARQASSRGMTSSDIVANIPKAYQELENIANSPEEPRMARLV